jgi:1-deoxy-D-xylulose-5-phosphate reductoisomerase
MKILLLGATGNIGQQTINVIKELNYQLVGISFYHNVKQATKIKAKYKYSPLDQSISNVSSYEELIKKAKPDIVVNAIVGFAGLEATIATIKNRRTLCLANKESMVVAGQFVTKLAKQNHVKIFPIDSEHAALFQILTQNSRNFKKLFITASGGPFYNASKKQLGNVTLAKAIKHPT